MRRDILNPGLQTALMQDVIDGLTRHPFGSHGTVTTNSGKHRAVLKVSCIQPGSEAGPCSSWDKSDSFLISLANDFESSILPHETGHIEVDDLRST
jgi:hypothetical protein